MWTRFSQKPLLWTSKIIFIVIIIGTADEFRKIVFFTDCKSGVTLWLLIVHSLICLSVSVDEILHKSRSIWYEIKTTFVVQIVLFHFCSSAADLNFKVLTKVVFYFKLFKERYWSHQSLSKQIWIILVRWQCSVSVTVNLTLGHMAFACRLALCCAKTYPRPKSTWPCNCHNKCAVLACPDTWKFPKSPEVVVAPADNSVSGNCRTHKSLITAVLLT